MDTYWYLGAVFNYEGGLMLGLPFLEIWCRPQPRSPTSQQRAAGGEMMQLSGSEDLAVPLGPL